jgi:hypothetical protein
MARYHRSRDLASTHPFPSRYVMTRNKSYRERTPENKIWETIDLVYMQEANDIQTGTILIALQREKKEDFAILHKQGWLGIRMNNCHTCV